MRDPLADKPHVGAECPGIPRGGPMPASNA
jgi:hypothetical protein